MKLVWINQQYQSSERDICEPQPHANSEQAQPDHKHKPSSQSLFC